MSIKFVDLRLVTKNTGVRTAKCKQFSRDSEGLTDALKSFGTDELIRLINKALRREVLVQLASEKKNENGG